MIHSTLMHAPSHSLERNNIIQIKHRWILNQEVGCINKEDVSFTILIRKNLLPQETKQ